MAPHLPARRAFCAGASGRRHGEFRPGRRLRRAVSSGRWCILTPPERRRPGRGRDVCRVLARTGRPRRDHAGARITTSCWRSPATCRTSSPTRSSAPPTSWPKSRAPRCSSSPPAAFATSPASRPPDPTMWRDVFLANKDAVLEMLGTFSEDLSQLTRAIRRGDGGRPVRPLHPHPRDPPRHRRRSDRIRRRLISGRPHPQAAGRCRCLAFALSDDRLNA